MKFKIFILLLIAPTLFAQEFSVRSIRAALEDELYALAEQQIWNALSIERSIEEKTDLTILLVRSLIGQKHVEDAVILSDESMHLLQPDAFIYWKARAFFEAGQIEQVFQTLKTIPKNSSFFPAALRLKGRSAVLDGDLKDAEKTFELFEKKFPDDKNAAQNLLDLTDVNLEREHGTSAVKTLNKLLERFPKTTEADSARQLLARELIANNGEKELIEAAQLLQKLGSTESAHPRLRITAWVELAGLEKAAGHSATAADALLQAETLTGETVLRVRQKTARANLLLDEKRFEEALILFDEAIHAATDEELATEVLIQKAEALLETKQFPQATEAFQGCLNITSQNTIQIRALAGKGWSLWEQKRFEESAAAFEQAAEICTNLSDRITAQVKAGDARFAAGQFEKAHADYHAVTENSHGHPLAARASYQSGAALLKTGALEKAALHFRMTEADFPESEFTQQAALQLAGLLKNEKQWEPALTEYVRIADQYTHAPTRTIALHQQGLILFELKRYTEALNVFDSVTETYPDATEAPQAFYMRGFCRYLQGDTDAALTLFRQFIDKYPASIWTPDVLFLVGEYAYNRGDYPQAKSTFLDIVSRFPQHELADDALFWTGNALLKQDSFLDAFSTYTRLAGEYPLSSLLLQTRFAQGEALTELGEFSRAILAYEEIIKLAQDEPLADRARGRLGDCLFTLGSSEPGRYQEAMEAYQSLYKRPSPPFDLKLQALYKIGRCEEKTGQADKAFAHYMEAVYSIGKQTSSLSPEAVLWFTRAALEAAAQQEQRQNWNEAVHIYERIIQAGVPAQSEAEKRIRKIKQDGRLE